VPGPDLLASSKVFYEAAIAGTAIYQSVTQRFSRSVWVYAVPILISTKDSLEAKDDTKLTRWIHAKQVVLEVTGAMATPDPHEPVPRAVRALPAWFHATRLLN
jgi:hypothetical protein